MDLNEFYWYEGFIEEFQGLNGRWLWNFTNVIDDEDSTVVSKVEFTDCFRKCEKVTFKINKPADAEDIDSVLPITEKYFFMKCYYIINDTAEIIRWSILELDWSNKTSKVGEEKFDCDLLDIVNHCPYTSLLDKALSNGDNLFFLIYRKENGDQWNCIHCKVNKIRLKFEQLGSNFDLPINLFKCINVNDNSIRGLSTSLTTISTFNLSNRKLLSPAQKVFGIPNSICLDLDNKAGFFYLPPVGAWTSTKLYLWSEKVLENKPSNSVVEVGERNIIRCCSCNIYAIDLIKGHTTQLPPTFYGQIREIFINGEDDETLIVRNEKYLKQEKFNRGMAAPYMRPFFEFKLFLMQTQ